MLPGHLEPTLVDLLGKILGRSVSILKCSPVRGGCIHHATELKTGQGSFFLKYNRIEELANFQAEARGLRLLESAGALKVPQVLLVSDSGSHAFILMEFILPGPHSDDFWTTFGHSLANLHWNTSSRYGLDHDNFIGRLSQSNTWHNNWISFFIEERMGAQLKLAKQKGLTSSNLHTAFEALFKRLPNLIPDEPPSLLHGDLWSGNFLVGPKGEACIVDPAVYYGHREAELAFTRLFGGFEPQFYSSYMNAWPLKEGWEERVGLFNLYPLMVHLNLFGKGYLREIYDILSKFS